MVRRCPSQFCIKLVDRLHIARRRLFNICKDITVLASDNRCVGNRGTGRRDFFANFTGPYIRLGFDGAIIILGNFSRNRSIREACEAVADRGANRVNASLGPVYLNVDTAPDISQVNLIDGLALLGEGLRRHSKNGCGTEEG